LTDILKNRVLNYYPDKIIAYIALKYYSAKDNN